MIINVRKIGWSNPMVYISNFWLAKRWTCKGSERGVRGELIGGITERNNYIILKKNLALTPNFAPSSVNKFSLFQ